MKISQINNVNYNSKMVNTKSNITRKNTEEQPSFKAHLKVASSAERAISGSLSKFREVCYLFGKKLEAETLHSGDIVHLRAITGTPKKIASGFHTVTPGHWENRGGYGGYKFVRDTVHSGQYGEIVTPAPASYATSYSSENLEVAINDSKTGFYYNDDCSEEQIAEDLLNAYKHVRYKEHYENPDLIDRIKNMLQ